MIQTFCHHMPPLCGPLTFTSVLTIWSPGVASIFGECRVCFRTALCAQKVYVAWKIISIFSEFVSKSSQKCRTLSQKCGKEGKMGDFSHHNCMSRALIGNNCPIKSITHWLGLMHMQTLYTNKNKPPNTSQNWSYFTIPILNDPCQNHMINSEIE